MCQPSFSASLLQREREREREKEGEKERAQSLLSEEKHVFNEVS